MMLQNLRLHHEKNNENAVVAKVWQGTSHNASHDSSHISSYNPFQPSAGLGNEVLRELLGVCHRTQIAEDLAS